MKKTDLAKKMNYVSSLKQGGAKPFGKHDGRESLEIPKSKTGKNEGNTMNEGKNENPRS